MTTAPPTASAECRALLTNFPAPPFNTLSHNHEPLRTFAMS
ncbi:hypothetical protein MY3296_010069 [Beauveria thailandica]